MKFETRPIILIISVTLCVWGVWNFEAWQSHGYFLNLVGTFLAGIAGIALALGQRWSQYFVYLSTLLLVLPLLYLWLPHIGDSLSDEGVTQTVISISPAGFLMIIALGSSYVVYRHFSGGETQA